MSNPDPAPPYVWVPGDHVQNMQELHQTMVAVDPDTGIPLDEQPDYPVHEPDAPPPDPPAARESETKKH